MDDRQTRYQRALEAAVRAKNPWLAASIRAAIRGEEFDPFEGLELHPEIDEMWGAEGKVVKTRREVGDGVSDLQLRALKGF